jgi:hypothetical protein
MMPVRGGPAVTLGAIATVAVAATMTVTSPEEAAAQLVGGSLSISVPASANLSSGTTIDSPSFSAALGDVTVTDTRTGAISGWSASASASATDFTTGSGSANERITKASISYWSGAATATSGLATFLPGQATALLAAPLSSTIVAFSAVTISGGTSATWRPTIVVTIPSGVVIGTYQGLITHSVS